MERDKHLKNILNNGGVDQAPKMFSHNIMAELIRQDEVKKEVNKPIIHKYTWWLLGSIATIISAIVVTQLTFIQGKYTLLANSMMSNASDSIAQINPYYLLIAAGVFLMLFFESVIRKRWMLTVQK